MYESYWGLKSRPFENSFVTDTYYPSELHQATLLKLRYAIEHRRAAAVLAGPSGLGKTLLLRRLESQLPEHAGPYFCVNYTYMKADQLLLQIASRFDPRLQQAGGESLARALEAIEMFLRDNCRQGKQAVLVVDEAHTLDAAHELESLRQLLNLAVDAASGEAALTLILCGMPSLIAQVHRNGALHDRVSVQCVLQQFTTNDTGAYIAHRLRTCGTERHQIFTGDALDLIHRLTDGVPRRINSLCDLALMVGYAQEMESIDGMLIESIHAELHPSAFISEIAS